MAGQKQQAKNGSGGESQFKILADNRQARFNYELLDRYECGLVLTGTEVKAARTGRINLQDAFAEIENGEAWLINAHFSPYTHGNRYNHEPVRKRKMLLHRGEIDKIYGKTRDKGFTLVPTKVFLKDGLVKCEVALARGKKHHDKRESEKKREQEAEARAAVGRRAKGA